MISSKAIDIEKEHALILRAVLSGYLSAGTRVYAFGSRAKGESRRNSDLDLAMLGDDAPDKTIVELKEAFYESNLPYKVDIINLHGIQDDFKQVILGDLVPILWDWREVCLGDIGFFRGGVTSIKKEDYGYGTPFIQYMNVYKNWKVDVNNLELMNVRDQDLQRKDCKYGDIFFTASSETEDEVAISSVLLDDISNLTFNGFCKRYRLYDFDTLLPEYARYLFRGKYFRGEVYKRVTGDVRFNMSQKSLASIPITIPDTKEQRKIAEVLSCLDDKIDLLHRQNKTLEQTASAVAQYWLAAKKNQEWKKGKISDLATFEQGEQVKAGLENYLEIGDVNIGTRDYNIDGKEKPTVKGAVKVPEGIVLISTVRPTRGAITTTKSDVNVSNAFCRLRLHSKYVYPFFDRDFFEHLGNVSTGTTYPVCKKQDILDYEITIPPKNLLAKYDAIVAPMFAKIALNKKQIRTLHQTRNTLLPQLISGKIRVKC